MILTGSIPVEVSAWITQRERVRSMRMRRHLAAAVAAALLLGLLVPVALAL